MVKIALNSRFGFLTVIGVGPPKGRLKTALCRCDCGAEKVITRAGLPKRLTCCHRCPLRNVKRTHGLILGHKQTSEYRLWVAIKMRCYNPKSTSYRLYGERGITLWHGWLDDPAAFADYIKENLGDRPPRFSLDRINNDENYEPGNIRWADQTTQRRNTRINRWVSAFGERLVISEWAERTGIARGVIRDRLNKGWNTESAVSIVPQPWRGGPVAARRWRTEKQDKHV